MNKLIKEGRHEVVTGRNVFPRENNWENYFSSDLQDYSVFFFFLSTLLFNREKKLKKKKNSYESEVRKNFHSSET